jgi:hypothetical protein
VNEAISGQAAGGPSNPTAEDPTSVLNEINEMARRRNEREAEERRLGLMPQGATPQQQFARPTQVVKRLIKELDENGCETYRVEFLFDKAEVST